MKNRPGSPGGAAGRIEVQMAPMIDVVFQLLIFFILTLKIIQPEGHFDINMPTGDVIERPDRLPQEIRVRLTANEDGSLREVLLGDHSLGRESPACFQDLNGQIARIVGSAGQAADDVAVEIDAAYNLDYEYTLKAVSACVGRIDPDTQQRVNYVSNIRFKPAQQP